MSSIWIFFGENHSIPSNANKIISEETTQVTRQCSHSKSFNNKTFPHEILVHKTEFVLVKHSKMSMSAVAKQQNCCSCTFSLFVCIFRWKWLGKCWKNVEKMSLIYQAEYLLLSKNDVNEFSFRSYLMKFGRSE